MPKWKLHLLCLTAAIAAPLPALAELEVDYGAFVENDLRFYVDRVDDPGIGRNQTSLGGDIKASLIPDRLRFVGDLKFVWTGFARDADYEGLTQRDTVSPYYLESSAAYLEVLSILPSLDLRIGRQVVHWGTATMFSPTDNLNAFDFEDPLEFGEAIANQMIRVDWAATDNFIFSAVLVPVFQPAQLPPSGKLIIADTGSELPYVDPATRLEGEKLRAIWLRNEDLYDIATPSFHAEMPDFSLENMQFALKVQWVMGLFDMSLSYYQGLDSLPVPTGSYSTKRPTDAVAPNGTPKIGISTDVEAKYPKKKAVGFDLSGQVPFLDDAGIWFEGAYFFPERVGFVFDITDAVSGARVIRGDALSDEPFFKCTAGMDYTINEHLFLLAQYIHGFIDEFGAEKVNDYWMGGLDLKFFREKLLLRLFVIGEIPHEDDDLELDKDDDGLVETLAPGATNDGTIAGYVLFPQISVKPMDGLDISLGSYFLIGHAESKLAMPGAGPSLAFLRARASF